MFDVIKFLQAYNIPYLSRGANIGKGWVGINCPLCGDTGHHGGFNLAGGYYYCWKCGSHPVRVLLSIFDSVNSPYTLLERFDTTPVYYSSTNTEHAVSVEVPGEPLQKMHRIYLEKRGFDPDELVDKYKITGGGYTGEWQYRIIIPIIQHGTVVSLQGRGIHPSITPRYKTLAVEKSIIDPKHCLYNIDNVHSDRIAVVEGVFDVWKLGDNVVCTLGTSVTERQIRLLAEYKEVLFLFDPEGPAQDKAKKAAEKVAALGSSVSIIDTQYGHDPGDFTDDEIEYIRKELGLD